MQNQLIPCPTSVHGLSSAGAVEVEVACSERGCRSFEACCRRKLHSGKWHWKVEELSVRWSKYTARDCYQQKSTLFAQSRGVVSGLFQLRACPFREKTMGVSTPQYGHRWTERSREGGTPWLGFTELVMRALKPRPLICRPLSGLE